MTALNLNDRLYCHQKARPLGSPFYYSTLNLSQDKKDVLCALFALCLELERTIFIPDLTIFYQTQSFWHQEFAQFEAKTPTHPITRLLAYYQQSYPLPARFLVQLADAITARRNYNCYHDSTELLQQDYRPVSALPLLLTKLQPKDQPESLQFCHDMGLSLQLGAGLLALPYEYPQQHVCLAENELTHFELNSTLLKQQCTTPAFAAFFKTQLDRINFYRQEALKKLAPAQQSHFGPCFTLIAIQSVILQRYAKMPSRLFSNQPLIISPLRQLWIALTRS